MENAHLHTATAVLESFAVDPKRGLSPEARQRARKYFGTNEMPIPPAKSFFRLVFNQFQDVLVLVLLAAAFVSLFLALFETRTNDRTTAFVEPIVILMILIANAAVGVWQEKNAEESILSLKQLSAEQAKVLIAGKVVVAKSDDVVPGDIVQFDAGDKIPADIRVISINGTCLYVDESCLTGESDAVNKTNEVMLDSGAHMVDQDKKNIVFSSTLITRGHGVGVVVRVGRGTAIGKIQAAIATAETEETPLQVSLNEFGEQLSKLIGVICIVVWAINIHHFTDPELGGVFAGAIHYLKTAISLAVAAIPEGLPAVVTTCLALGTRRMAQRHAIVRRLASVETLGCTSVICSDKTGTLTTNEMTVRKVVTIRNNDKTGSVELQTFSVHGDGWSPVGEVVCDSTNSCLTSPSMMNLSLSKISLISSLCNQSSLQYDPITQQFSKLGESTEVALKVLTEKLGTDQTGVTSNLYDRASKYWHALYQREALLDFDRTRKSMSVLVSNGGSRTLLVKGAPESIICRSTTAMVSNGKTVPLTESLKKLFISQMEHYAAEGLRCLALSFIPESDESPIVLLEPTDEYSEKIEQNMTFVGLVAMLDPPRSQVFEAIKRCHSAGIRVIVVTGDNLTTGMAICKQIGIFGTQDDLEEKAVTGMQFNAMTATQQSMCVSHCRLFARVDPAHKQRLVQLLKSQGHVVAMTGDGVNDAPALQYADIGIAMGSGTAVARSASDMVLQDDDFGAIIDAVEQGRAIYSNTRAFIRYLISSNIGEVVCVFLTALLGIPEVLNPVQLLWVNLVTDGLPATALGFNPADCDLMAEKPRPRTEPIVSRMKMVRFLIIGLYIGIATISGFLWWYLYSNSGPQITLRQLTSFHTCSSNPLNFSGIDCDIFFNDKTASTIALSILVVVEMFNAFNALSENQSLFVIPFWSNPYLLCAISLSMMCHFLILYVPTFASIFGVVALNLYQWKAVIFFSAPVILLDEAMKFAGRNTVSIPMDGRWYALSGRSTSNRYRRFIENDPQSLSEANSASVSMDQLVGCN